MPGFTSVYCFFPPPVFTLCGFFNKCKVLQAFIALFLSSQGGGSAVIMGPSPGGPFKSIKKVKKKCCRFLATEHFFYFFYFFLLFYFFYFFYFFRFSTFFTTQFGSIPCEMLCFTTFSIGFRVRPWRAWCWPPQALSLILYAFSPDPPKKVIKVMAASRAVWLFYFFTFLPFLLYSF